MYVCVRVCVCVGVECCRNEGCVGLDGVCVCVCVCGMWQELRVCGCGWCMYVHTHWDGVEGS
jgi:hypothetical protein